MAGALRRSPVHDRHVVLGARMAEFGGWEMPIQYTGVVEEHLAVRETAEWSFVHQQRAAPGNA